MCMLIIIKNLGIYLKAKFNLINCIIARYFDFCIIASQNKHHKMSLCEIDSLNKVKAW